MVVKFHHKVKTDIVTMNNHDDDNFKKENRQLIDKKKEEFKNRKLKVKEQNDLKKLGLEGDDGLEYLKTREVFIDKELERIKKDEDSVFYKKEKLVSMVEMKIIKNG